MSIHLRISLSTAILDQILEHFAGGDAEEAVASELCAELPGLNVANARRLAREVWRAYLQDARLARPLGHAKGTRWGEPTTWGNGQEYRNGDVGK